MEENRLKKIIACFPLLNILCFVPDEYDPVVVVIIMIGHIWEVFILPCEFHDLGFLFKPCDLAVGKPNTVRTNNLFFFTMSLGQYLVKELDNNSRDMSALFNSCVWLWAF